jgi:hypothetical protein
MKYSGIMIDSIVTKIKGMLLDPVETFQQSKDDEPKAVLVYYAVLVIINSLFYTIMSIVGLNPPSDTIPGSGNIFIIFGFAVFSSFILAVLFVAWLHVWVYILGGRKGIFQTAKTFVYAGTPYFLLGWLPYIGFIFLIWSFILSVLGIRDLHEISIVRAGVALAIAIVVPIVLLVILAMILFVSYMTLVNIA